MQTQEYYGDYWAKGQDGWSARAVSIVPAEVAHLRRHIRKGMRVLDVGCGDGRLAPVLTSLGADYSGIELSESAVRFCREKSLAVTQCDITQRWPIPDASYDAAVSFEVLEHLFMPGACLAEARRAVRPGGIILGSVPNVACIANRLLLLAGIFNPGGSPATSLRRPWEDAHIRFFTRCSLHRLLATELGLSDVTVSGAPFSWLDLPALYRLGGAARRILELGSLPFAPLGRLWPSLFSNRLYFHGRIPEGSR